MALRKAGLPIQFAGGLETQLDHKSVPTTKLLDLQNAVFKRATTLSKRNGYRSLSQAIEASGALYENPRGLAARADELLLFTDDRSYSYRPSSDTWDDAGEVASVVATDVPIARTGFQQWCADTATVSGVTAVAWEDSRGGVYACVVEDATGRILLAPVEMDADGTQPRCVAIGQVIGILWTDETAGRIFISIVNPATPTETLTSSILTDDLNPTAGRGRYDAEPMPTTMIDGVAVTATGGAVIAWNEIGNGYRVGYIAQSGVLGSPVTGFPSVATWTDTAAGPISIATDKQIGGGPIAVVWNGVSIPSVQGRFHDPTDLAVALRGGAALGLGVSIGLTTYNHITCEFGAVEDGESGPTLVWAAEESAARMDLCSVHTGKALQTVADYDAFSTELRGHVLLTRAFHDGTRLAPDIGNPAIRTPVATRTDGYVYVTVGHAVRFFPYAMVIRLSDPGTATGQCEAIPVARLLPGTTPGHHMRFAPDGSGSIIHHLPSVEARGMTGDEQYSRQHRLPLGVRLQLDSEDGDQFAEVGIRLSTLDFDADTSYQTAELGRGLYLAGAHPGHYDGGRWVEADYHTAPDLGVDVNGVAVELETLFDPQNVGGDMLPGSYVYKLWYEDVDGQGELHPGPTSVGVLVEVPADGSDSVAITIPTYRLTRKSNVRLCVARSQAGQTGTEESIPLYRVTSIDPTNLGGAENGFVVNNRGADSDITFTDIIDDVELLKREPLYTNGGILPNAPAPWSGACISGGKSRLFWTDPGDPHLVRFSQQLRDETGLEAPTDLTLRTDPYGGSIVTIAEMDGAFYPLKETAVYVFGGPGPLANPSASPESNAFSSPELVTADVGCASPTTVVQSPPGIVFDTAKGIRLLTRQRQIVPIGAPVDAFSGQTFKRATLIPDRPHIVFLTDSGSTLLFDYERVQWSRFTNHEGIDATLIDGVYHYLRTDGRVFVETPDIHRDDNSQIRMKIETAWVKMIGYLQGWQKILYANFLGEYKSAHSLRVRYRIDYQAGYSAPFDLDVNVNFNPALYGEGIYGEGLYGGAESASTVYQRRIHLNRRCQSISFLIEDVEATDDFGASFELSELLLSGGVLGPEFKMGAARSS